MTLAKENDEISVPSDDTIRGQVRTGPSEPSHSGHSE